VAIDQLQYTRPQASVYLTRQGNEILRQMIEKLLIAQHGCPESEEETLGRLAEGVS
jgi:hypothetical protein